MQSVILTELGIAVFDGPKCVKSFPFSDAAAEYMAVKQGTAELEDLVRYAESLDTSVVVNDAALLGVLHSRSVEAQLADTKYTARIQADRPQILVDAGFASDRDDAVARLRDFAMGLSSAKIAAVSQSPDIHIIQAVRTMDEIDRTLNAYNSRLREWYGLHFPELENVIDDIVPYAKIAQIGRRSEMSDASLERAGLESATAEMVVLLASKSRGGEITDENLGLIRKITEHVVEMAASRRELDEHISREMESTAPNTSAILGAHIGARIIARAGSLERLATMPASSIQVIGAEKALFRSLKTGAPPPKHGLLFQHQLVHAAPRWQRGKMARAIASKAAIAARVDMYGDGLNETLLEKLNVRAREIGSEPRPPPKPQRAAHGASKQRAAHRSKKARPRRFDRRSGVHAR